MIRTVAARALALLLAALLVLAASVYPASKPVLGAAVVAVGALLWWRPVLWLLIVPALLPVLDFAPWTGWFYLDELDLLLLTVGAVGYWRLAAAPVAARLPRFGGALLALVALSFGVSTLIGVLPLAPLDANAFSNYMSRYNGLRELKGFVWALLLLPLLRRSAGDELVNLRRYFGPGMMAGLALACAAVVWERAAFPGLSNFSSDYRPTAPFSAMHTGGAALDAYLAISFPFVALWLVGSTSRRQLGVAIGLLLLGAYAGLTLFSRDIYLAYGSSLIVLVLLSATFRLRRGTLDLRAIATGALALAACAYLLHDVFASSGYRGLAAAIGLLCAALVASAARQRPFPLALCAGVATALLAVVGGLFVLHEKGAYLGYTVAAAACAVGALMLASGSPARRTQALALTAGALPALALAVVLVARHWGGDKAIADAVIVVAAALALFAANRAPLLPLWELGRGTLTAALFGAVFCAILIPIAGSYYTTERFSTVGSDIGVRLRHWQEALDMMTPDTATSAAGMGLGRYPDVYFWNNTHGELPGSYSFQREADGNAVLRLGTPQYALGYGEVLRMLQRIDIQPGHQYRFGFDLMRHRSDTGVTLAICERWLLYPQNCISANYKARPADGKWQHYEVPFASGNLGAGSLMRLPTQLELSAEGANATVELDNVSVVDLTTGADLVRNGSFTQANDYWFFSSDRNHFPWHIKNFFVNTYFEMGVFGMVSLGLLMLYAAGQLAMRGLHGDLGASTALAAMAGFIMVGLFDSLFDVPRLTLVFFLVLMTSLLAPPRTPRAPAKRRRRSAVASADAAAADAVPDPVVSTTVPAAPQA